MSACCSVYDSIEREKEYASTRSLLLCPDDPLLVTDFLPSTYVISGYCTRDEIRRRPTFKVFDKIWKPTVLSLV